MLFGLLLSFTNILLVKLNKSPNNIGRHEIVVDHIVTYYQHWRRFIPERGRPWRSHVRSFVVPILLFVVFGSVVCAIMM